MEKKHQLFFEWIEEHHPDLVFKEEDVKKIFEENPKISFKKVVKELESKQQEVNTMAEQNTVNAETIIEEKTDDVIENISITVQPRGRCDDLVDSMSQWADQNPKTAVAVTVGGAALAAYGVYKLAREIF